MADVSWPADAVVRRSVASLIPAARNSRIHSEIQIGQVAASIKEWGWTVPVLIDEENGILAGHCRVMAAQKLGLDEIPVMVATGWSEAQKRAYVIADNKLSINSNWDEQLLKIELDDLRIEGFNLELTGFLPGELSNIFVLDTTSAAPPPSSAKEINTDEYQMGCKCPRCGFEFDDKQQQSTRVESV